MKGKKGLILETGQGFGEIAPLQNWSIETYEEAKEEILAYMYDRKKPTLPSVQFGLFCASSPISSIKVPLCALNKPHKMCTTLKLKLSHLSISEAISFVRPFLGKYRLRLDCNRAWTLNDALTFTEHFTKEDFEYLEEPLQTIEDLQTFSQNTHFPIALDETYREKGVIALTSLKAIVIKPTLSGNIPHLLYPMILSSSYESSLGIVQIARFANPDLAHGLDTFQDDLLDPPLKVEKGYLTWQSSKNPIRRKCLCLIATVP